MNKGDAIKAIFVGCVCSIVMLGLETNLLAQPTDASIKKFPPGVVPSIPQVVPNEVVVQYNKRSFTGSDSFEDRERQLNALGNQLSRELRIKFSREFDTDLRFSVIRTYPRLGSLRIKLPSEVSISKVIEALKNDERFEYVAPNYKIFGHGHNVSPPNDQYWLSHYPPSGPDPTLWGLQKIGMKNAWGVQAGGATIIAVLDSGIDFTHPDLQDNMWPSRGKNILYYGGNTDCVRGANDPTPMDHDGHGTMVAGTIAAYGHNDNPPDERTGFVGVNQRAQLMAVKIMCNEVGSVDPLEVSGNIEDAKDGVQYAIDHGATIINGSWGFNGLSPSNPHVAQLKETINSAKNTVLYVASAGNDSMDISSSSIWMWPQKFALRNEIVVAASNPGDELWVEPPLGSNYGTTSVDIAAPGQNIWSTCPSSICPPGEWGVGSGTSGAAPHVSGCAALMQARRATTHPSNPLRPADLKAILRTTADSVGLNVATGARLNCYAAVTAVESYCTRWGFWCRFHLLFEGMFTWFKGPSKPGPDPGPEEVRQPSDTGNPQ